MTTINYKAPPTCAEFMRSEAFFRIITGPVGSGKTTACIMELLARAIQQDKGTDGLRHTRFAIVRQTLKQLKDTVLKDILVWLDGIASYKVTDQAVYITFGDVRSEWLLIPLDDPDDQRRLLSMQLTGAWLSEAIEMSTEIVEPILGRCGRFPSAGTRPKDHTGEWPTWYGAIADTNMPTEGDSWHTLMETETPPHWQVFHQPGGLDPKAENIEHLPGGREYYVRLSEGHSEDWIKRYVHAQYGNDPTGSAVFKETFKKGFHSKRIERSGVDNGGTQNCALEPSYGHPLVIAQDFGRNPCALICQLDHKGRGLVLEELVSTGIGLEKHLVERLKPKLAEERYLGRAVYVIGDPAGRAKNTTFEETSFDTLKRHGFNAFPAPTNDIAKRIAAVENLLLQQRDGSAALLIDEDKCPVLVLSLSGRYRYTRKRTNGQLSVTPEKFHPWSDLADCLQYFCLAAAGGMGGYVANRINFQKAQVLNPARKRVSRLAWT